MTDDPTDLTHDRVAGAPQPTIRTSHVIDPADLYPPPTYSVHIAILPVPDTCLRDEPQSAEPDQTYRHPASSARSDSKTHRADDSTRDIQ